MIRFLNTPEHQPECLHPENRLYPENYIFWINICIYTKVFPLTTPESNSVIFVGLKTVVTRCVIIFFIITPKNVIDKFTLVNYTKL